MVRFVDGGSWRGVLVVRRLGLDAGGREEIWMGLAGRGVNVVMLAGCGEVRARLVTSCRWWTSAVRLQEDLSGVWALRECDHRVRVTGAEVRGWVRPVTSVVQVRTSWDSTEFPAKVESCIYRTMELGT